LAALAMVMAGCGGDGANSAADAPLVIYASLPLSGPQGPTGQTIARGAREALVDAGGLAGEHPIRLVILDDAGAGLRWDPVAIAANARRAAEDSSAIAYIGELDSGATRTSLPITNEAGIIQVMPATAAVEFTRATASGGDPDRYRPSGDRTFVSIENGSPRDRGRAAMLLVLDAIDAEGGSADRESVLDRVLG
jgi:branched-chain amino acid transport system substrate-binding protein